MICRELPERILGEKPQKTTRLIHPQSYTFDSSNSSTLTLSIVIPLRGSLAKSLPHHIQSSEKVIGVWEAVQERTNSFWLMQWANCKIRKARENKVRRNPIGARSLEGLGASGRLGLEGLLLFMYLNWFSSGSFYRLEGGGEVFHRVLWFPFR